MSKYMLTNSGEVAVQRAIALVTCKYPHLGKATTWQHFAKNKTVSAVFAQLVSDFWLKQHYLTGKNYTAVQWNKNYDRNIASTHPFFAHWSYDGGSWTKNRKPYQIRLSLFADD